MARKPESITGSGWTNTSISELVSELRDSFLSRDFDRVEEALVAREARLKAELKKKEKEILSLKDRIAFEMLERINVEMELKNVKEEKKKNDGFGLGNDESVKNGKCEVEGFGEVGGVKVRFLGERGGAEVKRENENERKVVTNGIKGFVNLERNGNGLRDSGRNLERRAVIVIEDSDEDECNSQATLDKKVTTACAIIDNDHQSSSGAFAKPLQTAEKIGNLKRKFAPLRELGTNINGFDGDTSSSSSSSCSSSDLFNMNNLPISDKKTKTDAASSGLNFSRR